MIDENKQWISVMPQLGRLVCSIPGGWGGGGAEKQIVSVVRKGNLRRVLGYCEGEADYRSNSVLGVVTTILVIETPRSIS